MIHLPCNIFHCTLPFILPLKPLCMCLRAHTRARVCVCVLWGVCAGLGERGGGGEGLAACVFMCVLNLHVLKAHDVHDVIV